MRKRIVELGLVEWSLAEASLHAHRLRIVVVYMMEDMPVRHIAVRLDVDCIL